MASSPPNSVANGKDQRDNVRERERENNTVTNIKGSGKKETEHILREESVYVRYQGELALTSASFLISAAFETISSLALVMTFFDLFSSSLQRMSSYKHSECVKITMYRSRVHRGYPYGIGRQSRSSTMKKLIICGTSLPSTVLDTQDLQKPRSIQLRCFSDYTTVEQMSATRVTPKRLLSGRLGYGHICTAGSLWDVLLQYCGKGVHQQQALVRKRKQCVHFEFGALVPYYMGDGGGGAGMQTVPCP